MCEAVLLDLVNSMQSCINNCEILVILMLDLSAIFNTTDSMILFDRLQRKFQVSRVPLRWLTSFPEKGHSHLKQVRRVVRGCLSF